MASAGKVNRREYLRQRSSALKSPGWTSATDSFFETPRHKNNRKRGSLANVMESSPYSPPTTRRSTMFISLAKDVNDESPTSTISEAGSSGNPPLTNVAAVKPPRRKPAAQVPKKMQKSAAITSRYTKKEAPATKPKKTAKESKKKNKSAPATSNGHASHDSSSDSEVEVKPSVSVAKKSKKATTNSRKAGSSRKTDIEDDMLIALAQEIAKGDWRRRHKRKAVAEASSCQPTHSEVKKLRVHATRLEEDVQLTSSPFFRTRNDVTPVKLTNAELMCEDDKDAESNRLETSTVSANASTASASNGKCVIL